MRRNLHQLCDSAGGKRHLTCQLDRKAKTFGSEAPNRPIEPGGGAPGLLAPVLASQYCDHRPLHPQEACKMFSRQYPRDRSDPTIKGAYAAGQVIPGCCHLSKSGTGQCWTHWLLQLADCFGAWLPGMTSSTANRSVLFIECEPLSLSSE